MISHQLVPPGGWKFKERENLTLSGMSWWDLVRTIRLHRQSNKIAPGNPEAEVDEQIAKLHPQLVMGGK